MNKLSSKKDPTGLGEVIGRVKEFEKDARSGKIQRKINESYLPKKVKEKEEKPKKSEVSDGSWGV